MSWGHRAEQYSLAIGRLWDCDATAYVLRSAARGSVLHLLDLSSTAAPLGPSGWGGRSAPNLRHARCRAAHSQNGLCSRVGGLDVRLILPYSPAFRVAGLVCTHNGHEDMRTWLQASPYELRVACCAPGMSFAGWVHPYQGPGHRVAHGPVGQPSGIITILSNRSTLTCIVRRVRSYTVSLGLCGVCACKIGLVSCP